MSKLWKQFANMPLAALFVIFVASIVSCSSAIEAQTQAPSSPPSFNRQVWDAMNKYHSSPPDQAPSVGIDQSVLIKAKAGDALSEASIAHAYLVGEGVQQDYAQAALWYAKAARQGDANSQRALGSLFHEGRGVPRDDAESALWYRKAADQGDAKAQYDLGLLYYKGKDAQQDKSQAVLWFRKAADQGDAKAQFALGWHYQHYWGEGQDRAQSAVWYRKAADQGFAKAQFELGEMYYTGDTVPQDMALAEIWARKAADQGDVEAQKLLSALVALEATRREERNVTIFVGICLVVFACLASVLFRNRKKLISHGNKLIPRTSRTKQLAVLLLAASWCSVSCLYQLFDPWMMRHPIDAAATALLFSAPAVIFGAVYLWWLSQVKKDT